MIEQLILHDGHGGDKLEHLDDEVLFINGMFNEHLKLDSLTKYGLKLIINKKINPCKLNCTRFSGMNKKT
jgi:hypothetical protein